MIEKISSSHATSAIKPYHLKFGAFVPSEHTLRVQWKSLLKAYLDRHIQVIHKKVNQIPEAERKQRRKRQKSPIVKTAIPAIPPKKLKKSEETKSFYVENLLKIQPSVNLAVDRRSLFVCTVSQNFAIMKTYYRKFQG